MIALRPRDQHVWDPRPRPRPITVRPRPRPRPKKWSRDRVYLETLTSLVFRCLYKPHYHLPTNYNSFCIDFGIVFRLIISLKSCCLMVGQPLALRWRNVRHGAVA